MLAPRMNESPDERAHAPDALPVFAALWAVATLFHEASYLGWAKSPLDVPLNVAAFFVLARPSSLARFTVLLLAQLVVAWAKLPNHPNHWLLTTLINVTMLLALLRAVVRGRGHVDRARFYLDFAPAVRLELLLMYAWAAFHKLNRDYFDPAVSCAVELQNAIASHYPFPTAPWAQMASVAGSVVVEAAIPVFLCVRRLRLAGIVLGALFHIVLALSPYPPPRVYNFSAMLFALYFLFAPVNLVALVRAWWNDSALRRYLPPAPFLREAAQWVFAVFLGGLVACVVFQQRGAVFETLLVRGPVVLWLLYASSTLAVFLLALGRGGARHLDLRGLVGVGSPLLALGPALVLLNGLSPYLGAKTETSFSMYSNLRTEGGATNHFVVRRPLRLFGYQEDLVTIFESSDPKLQWYADTGHVMTWFEFREHLGRRRKTAVRFQRGREPVQALTRSDEDPRLVPWPSWLRKLLFFRPAKIDGPVTCEH